MSADGPPSRRFSTGNEYLDRRVDGGIPPGALLALVAPPECQGQLILRELAGTRRTLYVSTVVPDTDQLRRQYLPPGADADPVYAPPADLLGDPSGLFERVDPESFLVLDSVDGLEALGDRASYLTFLNGLKRRLVERDSAAIAYCLDETPDRLRRLTLHRADVVWQLAPVYDKHQIRYQLLPTKTVGGEAPYEPVPLLLTDEVKIDTSWTI